MFKVKNILLALMIIFALAVILGCEEGEDYDLGTDEEFQQAAETLIEDVLEGELNEQEAVDQLNEDFSDRYSEEEIRENVSNRLNEKEEQLLGKIDAIEERNIELENKAVEYVEELEELVDVEQMIEIEEDISDGLDQIDSLYEELEATDDLYLTIDLLEDIEEIFEELVSLLEDNVEAAEEGDLEEDVAEEEPVEEPGEDPLADDLNAYFQQIEPVGEQETQVINSLEGVTGEQFEGDDALYEELVNNIIPTVENNILPELRNIEPETQELQNLHGQFISGWETQLEAFNLMVESVEEQDDQAMDQANQLLNEGSQQLGQFNEQLNQMAEQHGTDME